MGRDNQPKQRQARALARKKANRAGYDRILIVSEGEKTEPLYFEEIRRHYRLHIANIRVLQSAYGTTPQQVVDFAKDECLNTQEWEQVYCLFDRDDHPKANFDNALASVAAMDRKYRNELGQPIRFIAIPSIPCFELWLLLHFEAITRECHRDEVYRRLRQPNHLPEYAKGQGGHFARTRHLLDTAYANTATLAQQRNRHGNQNPFTAVDVLVKLLTGLKPDPCD